MAYRSIENKPAVDKDADTPKLKEEIMERILRIWLANPEEYLFDILTSATPAGGFPKKPTDRDYLHAIENYYKAKIQTTNN